MENPNNPNSKSSSEVQGPQSLIVRDAMMTAYSLTGSLSAASTLCSTLLDEELPEQYQASAVLTQLHHMAMTRPKH
ncbi:MAG: hypothetical protein ISR36_08645 [Gammaproteobacteria bacterium]|nr:hypothetical protein [Gammaproteobacteria bacterium]RZO22265.1 MAG: hypothetical protein EVB05_04315 [Candidatus Thioglobus sp.]